VVQVLVLHAPAHECVPPPELPAPEATGMNQTEWQRVFLPQEMLPDWSGMGPSACKYYNFTEQPTADWTEEEITAAQVTT
jgi:hypothetical protein